MEAVNSVVSVLFGVFYLLRLGTFCHPSSRRFFSCLYRTHFKRTEALIYERPSFAHKLFLSVTERETGNIILMNQYGGHSSDWPTFDEVAELAHDQLAQFSNLATSNL